MKAVFVDTDALPARESRAGDLVQNEGEASLAFTLAKALVASGIEENDMAVITPYRQQIKLLSKVFHAQEETKAVEILTADKAQGRDKDVILVSLVRSNEDGNVSESRLKLTVGRRPFARLAPHQRFLHSSQEKACHFWISFHTRQRSAPSRVLQVDGGKGVDTELAIWSRASSWGSSHSISTENCQYRQAPRQGELGASGQDRQAL